MFLKNGIKNFNISFKDSLKEVLKEMLKADLKEVADWRPQNQLILSNVPFLYTFVEVLWLCVQLDFCLLAPMTLNVLYLFRGPLQIASEIK